MRAISLRARLTLIFIAFAWVLILLVSLFTNVVLKNQFKTYTINKLEDTIADNISLISSRFVDKDTFDFEAIESIGINALSAGLMLRVTDADEKMIWDAWEHNNGFCTDMLEHMAGNMQTVNENFEGGYKEESYSIIKEGAVLGHVVVGYLGPYFFNDADIQYLTSLNRFFVIAALVSLLLCLVLGAYIAKNISYPITEAIAGTGQIAKGNYENKLVTNSKTHEIIALTDSVNKLAEELKQQELLRKRLTADVAHELRTPLATLQSHMEAMIEGIWKPEQKRLVSCHEEILSLGNLVGDLETLSKYDSESIKLDKKPFNLSDLVKRIVTNFENILREKQITFDLTLEENWVNADKDKIKQVVINLLSNAIKYTPAGGQIKIEVIERGRDVIFSISDTGMGISDADLPYIFERFYRTDLSRNKASGGSGIGLSIVKSIIDAHGGKVTVQSTLDEGSTFCFALEKQIN